MKLSRFTNLLFTLLFLGTGVFAAIFLYRDYQQFDNLRAENKILSKRHQSLAEESAKRERELEAIKTDPEFIESTARLKLNYAKEGEIIFRFER